MNDRLVNILTGLIGIVFVLAVSLLGIKVAGGALRPVYHVDALFSAAGQGLIKDSDVKVHGFNIGRVAGVRLSGGRALVRMAIDDGQRIPVDARATVRPKTLFGEKFVDIDPGRHERGGPFLKDGGRIQHAVGGFELEKVLTQAYPILKAVDPAELATLVGTLADAGRGMAPPSTARSSTGRRWPPSAPPTTPTPASSSPTSPTSPALSRITAVTSSGRRATSTSCCPT